MFSSRIKCCAYSVVIVILLINVVSLEAGRSRGGSWGGGHSSGRRGGGYKPPRPPVHYPKPPVYHPKPPAPVYHPPVYNPQPPPKANPPTVPHNSHVPASNNPKDSSDIFIKSEGGRRPLPGSTTSDHQKPQSPHQPSAPVHDQATRVNAGTQNAPNSNSGNTRSDYPIWANPHANPNNNPNPPNNPNPISNPSYPNSGKQPLPPYAPTHPPGPISNIPIIPNHQNPTHNGPPHGTFTPHQPHGNYPPPNQGPPPPYPGGPPHGISPHQPHGNIPPPYQAPPPYPVGNPHGMPTPIPPHIGFGNAGHNVGQHPPPYPYPSQGSPHISPHGGAMPHTQIINHNYGSPPIGSPQNPVGHPNYGHQPVYGGAPMGQPFIPGQTVLVMPNQQSSGPGIGQIFKEAIIHSTVNAAVNRIAFGSPYHHHHDTYQQPPPANPGGTTSTVTNTVIYNGYPSPAAGSNAGTIQGMPLPAQAGTPPGSPPTFPIGQPTGSASVPPGSGSVDPGVANPRIGVPASGLPGSSSQYPNPAATGMPNSPQVQNFPGNNANQSGQANAVAPNATSNETVAVAYPVQYYISNDELGNLTESLFAKDELSANRYITLNLQRRSLDPNATNDLASEPLLFVQKTAHDLPTIQTFRDTFDGYEFDWEKKELINQEQRRKENVMLDVFLNTDIMVTAMQWLSDKSYIEPDDFEWKDTLRHIWMSKVNGATSGFERIFLAEKYPGPLILGAQNWIYFDHQESLKRINYLSYADKVDLGDKASLVKVNFKIDDVLQRNTTMLVGTPPELEMALYTICYYARPNDICPVSLGGTRFNVYTRASRYFGKDLIDLGFLFF